MYEVNGLPSPQGNWYPVTKVAKSTPYSATFVRQLARQGKIDAIKIGRDWLITEQLVLQYIHTQQRRHRKALAILQTAEKAFLTLAFLAIVLSATPKARAEGLDTSTVQGTTISATLHDLASDWQGFESFLAEQFSALFHVIAPTLAEQSHSALASLGDDLLGKAPDNNLAEQPSPVLAIAKRPIAPRSLPIVAVASSDLGPQQPQVLGLSIGTTPDPSVPVGNSGSPGMSKAQIQTLIDRTLQSYLASSTQPTPQGSEAPTGASAIVVNNGGGITTLVVGGFPIASYISPVQSNGFSGAILSGLGGETANSNLTLQTASISSSLNVSGGTTLSSLAVTGTSSLATTTASSLTVSGPVTATTFYGDGSHLTGINTATSSQWTTLGSNIYYNAGNVGIGTTTPGQSLTLQGSGTTDLLNIASSSGTSDLYVTSAGNIGVGTTTPNQMLTLQGSGTTDLLNIETSAGTSTLYVTSGGNVGINTTTPNYNLTVGGTISTQDLITKGPYFDVRAYGAKCDNSTDDSAAFNAAITAAYNAGGGTIQIPKGTCVINSQLNFPNSGGGTPQQPAIRMIGQGASQSDALGLNPDGGTQLDLRYAGGPNDYKIITTGLGSLDFENISFIDTTDGTTQFLFTSNTTLLVRDDTFWGKTSAYSGTPAQDAIVLGGRTTRTAFQGYTTHIEDNYFGNIRRAVYAQQYANGVVLTGNTVTPSSGGNAAFEIDGVAPSFDTGTYAVGNLIEMVHYVYGFKMTNTTGGYFANSFYDTSSNIIGGYYDMASNATYNTLVQVVNDSYTFATGTSALDNTLLCNTQQGNGCETTFSQPIQFTAHPISFDAYGPSLTDSSGDTFGTQFTGGNQLSFNLTPYATSTEALASLAQISPSWTMFQLKNATRNTIQAPLSELEVYSAVGSTLFLGDSSNAVTITNGAITANHGISASFLSLTTPLAVSSGGTGTSTTPTSMGQLLADVGAGIYAPTTLVAGSNITVTTSTPGQITITSTASGGGGITASGTPGMLQFYGSSSALNANNKLFWDNTNDRLGIGTSTPNTALEVSSANENVLHLQDSATNGGGGEGDWYAAIGNGGNYTQGYLSITQGAPSASNYELQFQGGGLVQARGAFAAPSFDSSIQGRGTQPIMVWTNASTTGSGTLQLGQNYSNGDQYIASYINGNGAFDVRTHYNDGLLYVSATSSDVGIGTTAPASTLFVQGTGSTNPFVVASSTGTQLITVSPAGSLTTSDYPNCSGFTTNSSGLIQCTASDERLKQDIIPLGNQNGLAAINFLNPVSFYWQDPSRGTAEQFGLIAQQVQQIFPNLVSTTTPTALTPNGTLTLNYDGLISPLILAAQELSASSTAMQSSLTELQNQLSNLQLTVNSLQGELNGNASTSNLAVYSHSNFSGDSVGEAEIPAGQTSVRVSFSQPYAYQPIITAFPEGAFVPAFIAEKDSSGFTLALESATNTITTFDWHSFASPTEQLTVSGGATQSIVLVVASQPSSQPSDAAEGSSAPVLEDQVASSTPHSGQVLGDATGTPESGPSTTPVASGTLSPDSNANASGSPSSSDQSPAAQMQTPGTATPASDSSTSPSAPVTVTTSIQPPLEPASSSEAGDSPSPTASPVPGNVEAASPAGSGTSPSAPAALAPPTQTSSGPQIPSTTGDNSSSSTASPPPASTEAAPSVDSAAGSTSQ